MGGFDCRIQKQHLSQFGQGLAPALESDIPKEVAYGLHLLSLRMIKMGGLWKEALPYLRKALELTGYSDNDLLKTAASACNILKDFASMAEISFRCAYQAVQEGAYDRAAEALGFAWFAYSYKKLEQECDLSVVDTELFYKTIAGSIKADFPLAGRRKNTKPKIGHVVFRVYDQGYSPTRLLRTFVHHHDYEKFAVSVYNSEDIILRPQPKFLLASPLPPSNDSSGLTRKFLEERHVSYFVPSLEGSCLDSAQELAKRIYEDNIDVLIYHSSVMCPVACIVSYLKPAPVQINMNIGASMFLDSLDAVTYFTETALMTEKEFWNKRSIPCVSMPSGVDYSTEGEQVQVKRDVFSIPEDAVVYATCGNLLPQRMSDDFMRVVCELLQAHRKAYYLVIGDGDFSALQSALTRCNLLGRVRFAGFRKDAPWVVRIADIYLNEFPEGGGLSVLEAMIAAKPVVAMDSGGSITTSAGASYVGPEFALEKNDIKGYVLFARKLADDQAFRLRVGQALYKRYQETFSAQAMVRAFEELAAGLLVRKQEGRAAV